MTTNMKKAFTTFILLLAVMTVAAQMQDPVHVRSELKKISDSEGELLFSATIDPGWHVYSTGLGDGGPISAHVARSRRCSTRCSTWMCAISRVR